MKPDGPRGRRLCLVIHSSSESGPRRCPRAQSEVSSRSRERAHRLGDHAAQLVMSDFVRSEGTRLGEFVPKFLKSPNAALLTLGYGFSSGRLPLGHCESVGGATVRSSSAPCTPSTVAKHSTLATPRNPFTLWQHWQSLKNSPRHLGAAGGRVKAN